MPLRGHEFKEAAGNTMYVTSTKKNILHKLSGILRGHGSAEFLQKFDDNLYVHISDAMDELKRQLPHEKSLAQNWSVRTWLGIVANDECRYSVLAVSGLHNADAINIQSCPIKPLSWKAGILPPSRSSSTAGRTTAISMNTTLFSTGTPVCR